jgi:hypothetical protein
MIAFKSGGGGGADTTPPTTPTLTLGPVSSSSVSISWSASTDSGSGVSGYHVYRDGNLLTSVGKTTTSYVDGTVVAGTTYTYTVRAYDNASPPNVSAASNAVTAVVPTGSGGASVALVQQKAASGSLATLSDTLPAPSVTGNSLVATVALAAGASASVTSIADDGNNTWTRAGAGFLSGSNTRVEIWYSTGTTSASTVTLTLSAAKAASVDVSEWSGLAAAPPLDGVAQSANASSTSATTPSLPTTNGTDLVIGSINYPGSVTSTLSSTGGFTALQDFGTTGVHGRAAYVVTTTPGSYQATWTLSAATTSGGVIAAFKAA